MAAAAAAAAGTTESDCLDTAHDGQPGGEPGRVSGASGFQPAIAGALASPKHKSHITSG